MHVAHSAVVPAGATVLVGRHLVMESPNPLGLDFSSSWRIEHSALSRKQLRLTLPTGAHGVRVATVLTNKPSYVQNQAGPPEVLETDQAFAVKADGVLWLWGNPSHNPPYRHPIKIRVADAPPHVLPNDVAAAAPRVVGEWQVMLGRQFIKYEDVTVQQELESALIVRGEPTARVKVRGIEYIVQPVSGGGVRDFQQVQLKDKTKVRSVRRVEIEIASASSSSSSSNRAQHPEPPVASCLSGAILEGACNAGSSTADAKAVDSAGAKRRPPTHDAGALPKRTKQQQHPTHDEAPREAPRANAAPVTSADASGVSADDFMAIDDEAEAANHQTSRLAKAQKAPRAAAIRPKAAKKTSGAVCAPAASSSTTPSFSSTASIRLSSTALSSADAKHFEESRRISSTNSSRLEMALIDSHERSDGTIDLFGVDAAGASALLRVTGFRNFMYVQLSGGGRVGGTRGGTGGASASSAEGSVVEELEPHTTSTAKAIEDEGTATVPMTEEPLPEVLTCLRSVFRALKPCRLLLHAVSPVCKVWRQVAREVIADSVKAEVLDGLGGGAGSGGAGGSDEGDAPALEIEMVQRTPLLAYYGETLASVGRSTDGAAPGAMPGSDRSVPMLRVTYAARLKPKELLIALKKAAAAPALRGLLCTTPNGEVVSHETGLAPAGTSALLRRFAIEHSLAGGAWLVASGVRPLSIPGMRCARSFTCRHDAVDGKAPDILEPAANAEQWTALPPLTLLTVRVATTLGYTEPQWEAREATTSSGSADGVRMIACELRCAGGPSNGGDGGGKDGGRTHGGGKNGSSNTSIVLAVDPDMAAGDAAGRLSLAPIGESLPQIELRCFDDERALLAAFEKLVVEECDPDVLVTYDARALGLVIERHAELSTKGGGGGGGGGGGASRGAKSKAKGGSGAAMQLGREEGVGTRVVSVVTYSKAWASRPGARQQTSENLETHEVTGLGGRFSLDLLRALVCHQGHKLTTYSFGQAVEAVLGGEGGEGADAIEGVDIVEVNEAEAAASAEAEAEAELILPSVLAAAPTARVARHLAAQGRLLHRVAHKLKTLEETIEMARITGLPLRTIANQAQMVRTENLLLKAARSQGYVLPLSAGITPVPTALRWTSSEMVFDTRAYNHWP